MNSQINIDNVTLAVERGQALLEVLEDRLSDDTEAEALLNAIRDQFQAVNNETTKAIQ